MWRARPVTIVCASPLPTFFSNSAAIFLRRCIAAALPRSPRATGIIATATGPFGRHDRGALARLPAHAPSGAATLPWMCGRYTIRDPRRALAEFSILEKAPALEPRFNVAPSQGVWAVRIADASMRLELDLLQWGIAGKASPKSSAVIMVRSEGLAKRPPYAEAFRKRRCLLVADGFYEWRRAGRHSFPYYFARPDGAPFAIAAIWEPGDPKSEKLDTCALITRPALAPVDAVHNRMPALLPTAHRDRWLDPNFADMGALAAMLADPPEFALHARPVSTRVNSPANDDEGCTAPIEESERHGEQFELFPSRSA